MTLKTKAQLYAEIDTNYPDNTSGLITPAIQRTTEKDTIDSWQQAPSVNAQIGSAYTITVADFGKLVTFNSAVPVGVILPQATGAFSVFNVTLANIGAGTVTVTPTTSTIGGVASIQLVTRQVQTIVSDGVNYQLGQNTAVTVAGGTGFFIFADPINGLITKPITSADLPACQNIALGAVKAMPFVAHKFLQSLDEGGAFQQVQPSADDLVQGNYLESNADAGGGNIYNIMRYPGSAGDTTLRAIFLNALTKNADLKGNQFTFSDISGTLMALFNTLGLRNCKIDCDQAVSGNQVTNLFKTGLVRERLAAGRTYFVNGSTGSDTNDGRQATVGTAPAGPVATIQKAIDLIATNLDLLPGANAVISVADGAYTGPITLRSLVGAALTCTITGNTSTPANVTVTANNAAVFTANRSNTIWTLNGFKVVGTGNTASIGVSVANGSTVTLLNFDFGACTGGHIQSTSTSNVSINSNYTVSGGGPFHYNCTTNAQLVPGGRTITFNSAIASSTVTISNGGGTVPGVVTWNAHGLPINSIVIFSTTGTLPAPLVAGTQYHILAAGYGANSFQIATSPGGAAINTSTAGSGVHTATGHLSFTTAFAQCERSALILANAMTFTTATNVGGVRYQALTMGLIDTQSGSGTYFPGSIAGSPAPVATPFGAVVS